MAKSDLHKLQNLSSFHVGDIITSLQKGSLVAGGQETIIYSTMMGGIGMNRSAWLGECASLHQHDPCCPGVFLPFVSKGDVDLFEHLEMHMRQEHPPLAGRDHMAFRSAYIPVRDCIDGDLCEQFPQVWACCADRHMLLITTNHHIPPAQLPLDKQRTISDDIDRTPGEVMRRLEELRNKVM